MLHLIVTTAIAVASTPAGQAAIGKAAMVAPKVIQRAQSAVRGVQNATRRIATLTPNNPVVQVAPGVTRLAAGVAPVISGLTVTLTGCGGGGGSTVTSPPKVSEPQVPPAPPADCTCAQLAWDPNQEADLAGYTVHVGQSPGNYDPNSDWDVSTNNAMISGLERGRTYYFSVSAYDTAGNDSANSSEVSKTISMTAQ